MEMQMKLLCIVIVFSCGVDEFGIATKTDERLDALEHLVRGEIYFVRKDIENDKEDREKFMRDLNETLETFMETVISKKENTRQVYTNDNVGHVEKLITKSDTTGMELKELSEALARNKKGLLDEKKARKSDINELATKLNIINENQNYVLNNQTGILKQLADMTHSQNKTTTEQKNLFRQIQNITDCINATQNDLRMKTKAIETRQDQLVSQIDSHSNIILSRNTLLEDIVSKIDSQEKTLGEYQHAFSFFNASLLSQTNSLENLRLKVELTEEKIDAQEKELTLLKNSIPQQSLLNTEIRNFMNETRNAIKELRIETAEIKGSITVAQQNAQQENATVELVGGRRPYEGRVEINYQGRHGTICDDGWDNRDATVVCKMLGYSRGRIRHRIYGRPGTGDVLLRWVDCEGNETSLFLCKNAEIRVQNCTHAEDAGVRCYAHPSFL